MTKHKTDDYNNSAVKYYLNNENGDGYKKTCNIFDCKKNLTLRDWIYKYNTTKKSYKKNQETHFLQNNQTASKYCVRIIEEE